MSQLVKLFRTSEEIETVNWYYPSDDIEMRKTGEILAKITNKNIVIILKNKTN
jgi:hypothetical protein